MENVKYLLHNEKNILLIRLLILYIKIFIFPFFFIYDAPPKMTMERLEARTSPKGPQKFTEPTEIINNQKGWLKSSHV